MRCFARHFPTYVEQGPMVWRATCARFTSLCLLCTNSCTPKLVTRSATRARFNSAVNPPPVHKLVYTQVGDTVQTAEATADQVRAWAIVTVGLDEDDAGKIRMQKIAGRDLVELAKLPKADVEAKLLAPPYLLSGSAALNLAKAISELGSTSTVALSRPPNVVKRHKRATAYGPEDWADSEMVVEFFWKLREQSTAPAYELVGTYGRHFKVVDREYVADMLSELCQQRLEAHRAGMHDQRLHPISTFLGGPGLGKSYLAQNLLPMLQSKLALSSTQELRLLSKNAMHAIGTFGNGSTLCAAERRISASTSMGLRWLHRECAIREPFDAWLIRFSTTPELQIGQALNTLRQLRVRAGILQEDECLLVLGVCDEVNRLVEKDAPRFKELINDIGCACCSPPNNVFFVPWITGTAITQVSVYFTKSMHPPQHVPVRLLESYSQVVDHLPGFENWRTCEPFVRCLADVGPHPRALEFFLEHVSKKSAVGLELIDYPELMLSVRNKLETWYGTQQMTNQQRLHIVAAAILDQRVAGTTVFPDSSGLSWQELAERGTFLLDGDGRILLPFIWFWLHASALAMLSEYAPALSSWSEFFRPQVSEEAGGAGFWWQSFESFLARVLALRVNMYKALGKEMVPLLQLLGGRDAVDVCSSLLNIQVKIPDAYVKFHILASGQFPNSAVLKDTNGQVIDWQASCLSAKNMGGAAFDTFCSIFTPALFLLLGQAKHATRGNSNAVTSEVLHGEATKCAQAMCKLEAIPWALFVCCTHAAKNLQLPHRTIVTRNFDRFCGRTLASRGQLAAATGTKFKVNIARSAELMMWESIGPKISGDILTARSQRPFSDWDDLISRVAKFPMWIEDFVEF